MFERMKRGGEDDPADRDGTTGVDGRTRSEADRADDPGAERVYQEREGDDPRAPLDERDRTDVAARPGERADVGARDEVDHPRTGSDADRDDRGAVAQRDRDTRDEERALSAKERVHDVRERQRAEYGGFNLGAAFFGWLVALGLGALLTALLSATGAAIGLTTAPSGAEALQSADTISIAGAIALLVVLFIAYYAGGYVAGRMSRFNGGKQGVGVWVIALAVTIGLAVLGTLAGAEYNVLAQLNLPRIPVDEGTLASGSLIALLVVLVVTLLAAFLGGKQGVRYHKKVDRAGLTY